MMAMMSPTPPSTSRTHSIWDWQATWVPKLVIEPCKSTLMNSTTLKATLMSTAFTSASSITSSYLGRLLGRTQSALRVFPLHNFDLQASFQPLEYANG